MSDKMECPGCGGESSSILHAVSDGSPCPFCGLSADAIYEIRAVRRAKADEALKEQLETALKERDQFRAEAVALRNLAAEARIALGCEYPFSPHEKSDSWRRES